MTEWNKELEKKILRRSKFTLTIRMLRVLLILIFIYILYMSAINIISDKLDVRNENMYFSSLALEWSVPNVRGDFRAGEEELSILGTKKFSYNLMKTVGHKTTVIGEARVSKTLFSNFSNFQYSHSNQNRLSEISISLPEDPRTGRKLEANISPHVWETLEMLHEGTVAEFAFSTTEFMEPIQLIEALEEYDLHILWMPLYTGEFKYYEPSSHSWSTNTLRVPGLGLTGGKDHHEGYNESLRITHLTKDSVDESEKLMLNNMEKLLNKSEGYYERFLGLRHLKEQYEYLTEEGFTIYGAVVTGPVKELLKLKNLSFVQSEQLGEVELWNWR